MTYNFRLTNTFLKNKKRLPKHIIKRVTNSMKEILINPYTTGIMLTGDLKGLWKRRIGKYRIEYEIIENEKIVVFHTIDLRKRVHK